jgi:hypothetical protein
MDLTKKHLNFQCYGVKIGIITEKTEQLEKVKSQLEKIFPYGYEKLNDNEEIAFQFYIKTGNNNLIEFYHEEGKEFESIESDNFYDLVQSRIRLTIAEYAVGKVFLHAGVIGWKDRAIVIPARSFSGKTTLVAEMVKMGALYYSDEYAVLDENGNVEPFPKWLSMRGIIDERTQLDCSVESLGGIAGKTALPVGMILIARYDQAKKTPRRWQPQRLSEGQGIMEVLPHTMPIRNKPKFVLEVLNKLARRAIIIKTVRGDAREFAPLLLHFFEKQIA